MTLFEQNSEDKINPPGFFLLCSRPTLHKRGSFLFVRRMDHHV